MTCQTQATMNGTTVAELREELMSLKAILSSVWRSCTYMKSELCGADQHAAGDIPGR